LNSVTVGGRTFTFYDAGKGPAIVFLHSFGHNKLMWLPQLDALTSQGYRVLAADFEGHGGTYFDPHGYSIDRLADDTIQLLSHLGVSSAVFAGISMGGYVALKIWKKQPSLFRGLILSNTKAEPDTPEIMERRDRQIDFIKKHGTSAFVNEYAPKRLSPLTISSKPWVLDFISYLNRSIPSDVLIATLWAMKERTDDTPLLDHITVPTLIIVGGDDRHIPVNASQTLSSRIKKSTLVTLDGTSHVSNLEDPDRYNSHILNYLKALDTKESF